MWTGRSQQQTTDSVSCLDVSRKSHEKEIQIESLQSVRDYAVCGATKYLFPAVNRNQFCSDHKRLDVSAHPKLVEKQKKLINKISLQAESFFQSHFDWVYVNVELYARCLVWSNADSIHNRKCKYFTTTKWNGMLRNDTSCQKAKLLNVELWLTSFLRERGEWKTP